ncbi:VP7 [Orungo virus]|uniref:Core protein VP7 n=1 Tax=Orungo virus TaxID=40058 RepID=W5QLZ4_9REOV|nr:VP7 [Orungo virus]AFX73393.1 VP7 [Orungo virus]
MDAIAARALSVIQDCISVGDGRINLDPGVMERLGIAINRYNGLTNNVVTIRPGTQDERNAMFFMCLDFALAALNIQIGVISREYTQALATIGVLATGEIPYSVAAMDTIVRISGTMATWGPTEYELPPYARSQMIQMSGRYYVPAGANSHAAHVDPTTVEISLAAGVVVNVTNALQPRGVAPTMMYMVWHPLAIFANPQGATAASPQNMTLVVGGLNIAAGTIIAWDTVAPIQLSNQGGQEGMIAIRILWMTTLDKSMTSLPEMREIISRCYSFMHPSWHALRGTVLHSLNLPTNNPPMFAPATRQEALAYLILANLADAYTSLRPDFTIQGMLAVPQVIDRQFVQGAYR